MSDDFYDGEEGDLDLQSIDHVDYPDSHMEALRPDCGVFNLGLREALARSQLFAMNFIDADERPTLSELEFFWCGKAYAFQALKVALEANMSDGERVSDVSFTITDDDKVIVSAKREKIVYPINV